MIVTSPPYDFEGKKLGYNILTRTYDHVNYPLAGLGVNLKSLQTNRSQVSGSSKRWCAPIASCGRTAKSP